MKSANKSLLIGNLLNTVFLKNFIIYLFVTSLLSSSLSWAGQMVLDDKADTQEHIAHTSQNISSMGQSLATKVDNDSHDNHNNSLMHHLIDKHHGNHDCHLSAHLIGLHSNIISIALISTAQIYTPFTIQYSTLNIPPPNKPPRV